MQKILRKNELGGDVTISRGGILHTDIWLQSLKDSSDINQKLTQEIISHKQVTPTRDPMANPGCWRGSRAYDGWDILKKNIIANLKAIHGYYNQIGPPCMPLDNLKESAFEMVYWANVNEKGSTNAMHTHSKWHWSGCYYIQGTGTGQIALYSTPYLNQQVSYGLPFGQSFTIDTADGLLLIFPSYLMHEVLANPSDRQRINIAFNVRIDFEGNH
ncbi:MAG: hypothetical protein ACJAS9_000481 [Polaribacter sp.]|jgi:hypothetical protein